MRAAGLGALLLVAVASAGCDPEPGRDDAGSPEDAGVDGWEPCGAWECTSVAVPLDYEDPASESIDVRVLRIRARRARRGVLFFNPGGPGVATLSRVDELAEQFGLLVPDFDAILFDPRGSGQSAPLRCIEPALAERLRALPASPADDAAWVAVEALMREVAAACTEGDASGLAAHLSTEAVARDMDRIRERLGEARIHFLGFSYGTHLAAVYATLFPDRVGAFVLDSATWRPPVAFPEGEEGGHDAALGGFFGACGADPACAFHGGEGEGAVAAAWDALAAAAPSSLDFQAAASHALRRADLESYAADLSTAEAGSFAALTARADAFYGAAEPEPYATLSPLYATLRNDAPCPEGFDLAAARARWSQLETTAPRLGAIELFVDLACLGWPSAARSPVGVAAPSAPPMLLFGGARDPAAPTREARRLAEALGNGSHVVEYLGAGHGYLTRSGCVLSTSIEFLRDPSTPPPSATCD